MGNQANQALTEDVNVLLVQFPPLSTLCTAISSNKLFKTAKCTDQQNILYVKVFSTQGFDRVLYKQRLDYINSIIFRAPQRHLMTSALAENDLLGALIRPFIQTSLRQKLIRPPFLNPEEKIWISYLLMKAVQQLHELELPHGDIRPENFLLTSWDWVYLVDIAFYKPLKIFEGDLTSYNIFFAPGAREACYLAPERFESKLKENTEITLASDVFSLACVISEVFLDGAHLFTLPQTLAYKKSEIKVISKMSISDENIKNMLANMLSIDPSERWSINQCVKYWEENVLEKKFTVKIYEFLVRLLEKSHPDERVYFVSDFIKTIKINEYSVVFCSVLASTIRNVLTPSAKILAIKLMSQLAYTDDLKLHRVLPFFISMLTNEERSTVKCCSLNHIAELLSEVRYISAKDTHLFKEYIWPLVSMCKNDESEWVRYTLSDLLPKWAYIARRLLELGRHFSTFTDSFDTTLSTLGHLMSGIYQDLLKSKEESIQLILLQNFPKFAEYFTDEVARTGFREIIWPWVLEHEGKHTDSIFPYVDYEEKYQIALLEASENYVQTLGGYFFRHAFKALENNLYGHSELLVYLTLKTVNYHVRMNNDLLEKTLPFLLHPSIWIRNEMKNLIKEVLQQLDPTMNFLHIRPMIIPYLNLHASHVLIVDMDIITTHLHPNMRRSAFNSKLQGRDPELLPTEEKLRGSFSSLISMVRLQKYYYFSGPPAVIPEERIHYDGGPKSSMVSMRTKKPYYSQGSFYEGLGLTGELECVIDSHMSPVTHILPTSENLVLSASKDGKLLLWKLNRQEDYSKIKYRQRKECELPPVSVGRCGENVFVAYENLVHVWDQELSQIEHRFKTSCVADVTEMEGEVVAIAELNGDIRLKDMRTDELSHVFSLGAQKGILSKIIKISENAVAVGTISGHIVLFDLRFSIPAASYINSYKQPVLSMANYSCRYKPLIDGSQLLTSLSSEIVMWDLNTSRASVLFTKASEAPLQVPYLTLDDYYYPDIHTDLSYKANNDYERAKLLMPRLERLEQYTKISSNFVTSLTEFGLLVKKSWEKRSNVLKILVPSESNLILSTGEDAVVRVWDPISVKNSAIIGQGGLGKPEYCAVVIPDLLVVQEQISAPQCNRKKRRDFDDLNVGRKMSHSHTINDLVFLTQPKPILLTGSNDGTIRIWR